MIAPPATTHLILPRPGAPFARTILMFMLCFCGMMTGFAIDAQSLLPATITSLCLGSHSLAETVIGHASLLPMTNALMVVGGLAALGLELGTASRGGSALRFAGALGCCALMLAGMFLGEWLGPQLATEAGMPWTVTAMVVAMTSGMAIGMVGWQMLGRFPATTAGPNRSARRWAARRRSRNTSRRRCR